MTNEEAVALAKDKFTTAAEAAINAALLASPLAIIEAPPWSLLTHEAVHWIAQTLAKDAELAVFFAYINFNVNQQGHDFIQAVLQNKLAQQTGTEDEKKIAQKNLINLFV
jgi:hypothetical protein